MEDDCIFCKIAKGIEPCHKIWENEEFLAFLSIFPNTQGSSIVIPKRHYPSYAFDLSDDILTQLLTASKTVARLLDANLDNVGRTALILEGTGVDHLHSKLIPLHGTGRLKKWKPPVSHIDKYFQEYEGYISSHDYVRASDRDLEKLASRITNS